MKHEIINPRDWAAPKGYNNAIKAKGGSFVFIAGQVAWDANAKIVGKGNFVQQFDQAMKNFVTVLKQAKGMPEDVVKMNLYVTDKKAYLDHVAAVGEAYRWHMGKHFPAMTMVEVKGLVEEDAMVEIEGIAII